MGIYVAVAIFALGVFSLIADGGDWWTR